MKKVIPAISFALVCALTPWNCLAVQFDAAVPPKGALYFKMHPLVFLTTAKFDDSGTSTSPVHLSQLSYIDTQIELYYGITDSLMAGVLLPVGYIRKSYVAEGTSSITKMRNPWIIIKHQFWPEIVCTASSLRIKLPITDIDPLEEGFDIDDKQVDIYPVYYVDWVSSLGVYIYGQIGYKYRMEDGDQIKPSDELKLLVETGYAIVPGIIRMFTYSDFTRFFVGRIKDEEDKFSEGYLYTIGAGVRFFLGPVRVEVLTNANPFGRNQFRGVGGHVGIGYVFGI